MLNRDKIETLHRRLKDERCRLIQAAAATDAVPAANLLAHLAHIDGAALAIETMLHESFDASELRLQDTSANTRPM